MLDEHLESSDKDTKHDVSEQICIKSVRAASSACDLKDTLNNSRPRFVFCCLFFLLIKLGIEI